MLAMASRCTVPVATSRAAGLARRNTTDAKSARRAACVPRPRASSRRARTALAATDDDDDDLFSFLEAQMAEEEGADGGVAVSGSDARADDYIGEPGSAMDGEELRKLVLNKWGKMYDTRIHQRRDQFNKLGLYLQIMWKFVGQKSFPMTEAQYVEQLDAVAELLTEWGAQDTVRAAIPACTKFPKMDTTGANAVMIPLDVQLDDDDDA
jgi:hypothetical protein